MLLLSNASRNLTQSDAKLLIRFKACHLILDHITLEYQDMLFYVTLVCYIYKTNTKTNKNMITLERYSVTALCSVKVDAHEILKGPTGKKKKR